MKNLVILAFLTVAMTNPPLQKTLYVPAATKPFKKQIGAITGLNGKPLYYVVTEFYTVQAAIQLHGYSSIIFLDKNRMVAAKYLVNLPEELPEKVVENALVFNYPNQAGKHSKHKQLIGGELPELICVGPDNCFQKQ